MTFSRKQGSLSALRSRLRSGIEVPLLPHDKSGIRNLRAQLRNYIKGERLPFAEMHDIASDSIAGRTKAIPLRRYLPVEPSSTAQPAILYFHGGCWVAGDLDSHDDICRSMANRTGYQLISVDYRLAPEHPFPAAYEDAIDSYSMILARAAEWNIDSHSIAVMGDGCGATLANIVSIHARDMCQPIPAAQILFYPVTNMATESPSFHEHGGMAGVSRETIRWFYRQYVRDDQDLVDWRVSPMMVESTAGLPPSFIAVGDRDPLHDEASAMAERLYKAGVMTRLMVIPSQIHGFLSIGGLTTDAGQSLDAAAHFLEAGLAQARSQNRPTNKSRQP